jgi:hypothetical protein
MVIKTLIGAATVAALGIGGASVAAAQGSDPSTGQGSTNRASAAPGDRGQRGAVLRDLARRSVHGELVTRGKGDTFVTHDFIRGTVTSVSATALTVRAADNTSESFVVGKDTTVRSRSAHAKTVISDVHAGDRVIVLGTGSATRTATHVLDLG